MHRQPGLGTSGVPPAHHPSRQLDLLGMGPVWADFRTSAQSSLEASTGRRGWTDGADTHGYRHPKMGVAVTVFCLLSAPSLTV